MYMYVCLTKVNKKLIIDKSLTHIEYHEYRYKMYNCKYFYRLSAVVLPEHLNWLIDFGQLLSPLENLLYIWTHSLIALMSPDSTLTTERENQH